MTRRGKFLYLILLALPLFALRLCDIVGGRVENPSGFLTAGAGWLQIAELALAVIGAAAASRLPSGGDFSAASALARIFFAATAIAAALASAAQLSDVLSRHAIEEFFMTRAQLAALNIRDSGFKLAALCGIAGLAAALWFALSAVKGAPLGALGLAVMPTAWFALRAVVCFAKGPVNSNDTLTVADIASSMALAALFAALGRLAALGRDDKTARRFVWLAALGGYFAIGFALPGAYFYAMNGNAADSLLTLAAALAAASAISLALGAPDGETGISSDDIKEKNERENG